MNARLLSLLGALPVVAAAQVGHMPDASPFRDVNVAGRMAIYAGWYAGARDEAGVLPRSGPLVGARMDVHVGGPADLAFRIARVGTERHVIDPTKAADDRLVENRTLSLGFADVGLSFNLTGAKSWHSLMPTVNGSVGIVSDFRGRDVGGFSHGTTFAVGYGLGLRYVPPNARYALRADAGSYMYSLQYPTSYYAIGGDGTAVLPGTVPRSQWRNNWTISAGFSYTVFK
jgi:hypothetical protein